LHRMVDHALMAAARFEKLRPIAWRTGMSWRDSQRLIARGRTVRRSGWAAFGLLVLVVAADAVLGDPRGGLTVTLLAGITGAVILAVSHGVAWLLDRRAERVVGK
jgi:hypothetical protein